MIHGSYVSRFYFWLSVFLEILEMSQPTLHRTTEVVRTKSILDQCDLFSVGLVLLMAMPDACFIDHYSHKM